MSGTSPPLVSVCIPTYNHERYIAQCLNSVLMQAHSVGRSIEILIGDDLSTDGTGDIIQEIAASAPDFVRYFRHAENKGAVGNLEFLIREARGRYIAHLDGDDFWLPEKLKKQLEFLEANSDCPAVYCNAFCIYDDGSPAGIFSNFKHDRVSLSYLVRRGNFLNHSSLLYRSSFKECILPPQGSLLDFSTHLSLAKQGVLGYLSTSLSVYRVSSGTSILSHREEYIRELYWEALLSVRFPFVSSSDINAGIAEFMRAVFFRALMLGSFRLISSWWFSALCQAPLGRSRLLLRVFLAIFRASLRATVAWACRLFSGNKLRILYLR